MKITTWNVNSVRARKNHILAWLETARPHALLLQETKCEGADFPFADFRAAGYESFCCGQKAYNGCAVLSRLPIADAQCGMPNRPHDKQARVAAVTVAPSGGGENLRLISAYIPNGGEVGAEKYEYKLEWLADFAEYIADAARDFPGGVAAGGDYNIAPADEDIYDPAHWGAGNILVSKPERAAFAGLLARGYADAHRLFTQPRGVFSWWDYRAASFSRNRGLRIDMFLLTPPLATKCESCAPDSAPRTWEKPSDHAPVTVRLRAEE